MDHTRMATASVDTNAATVAGCPAAHGASERKSERGAAGEAPAVERIGDVWHVRSYDGVRQVLRAEGTRQAGFNAELAMRSGLRQPVLFQDGEAHRVQRTAIAPFFTPKTVDADYTELMETLSDDIVDDLRRRGRGDVGAMSLALAVEVAARVVGLTDSRRPGLGRRLERVLALERFEGQHTLQRTAGMVAAQGRLLHFYLQDVRPAIAARRKAPREDVISHLLAHGYKDAEILIECVTYGAAGMGTTREFIAMAAWHLLERDDLRRRYLGAQEDERHRVLHEILRLEPIVGHLHRRTQREIVVEDGGARHVIPAGARIDLDVGAANTDPAAVGADGRCLRPARVLAPKVQPPAMSFGDGAHRCPGAFVAIKESDVFLQRLLRLPLQIVTAPTLTWNDLIEGYEVRDLEVAVA